MSTSPNGGPAFPKQAFTGPNGVVETANGYFSDMDGMSLRDYFAAKAMHAEVMTCGVPGEACESLIRAAKSKGHTPELHMAINAYEMADAMLEARK